MKLNIKGSDGNEIKLEGAEKEFSEKFLFMIAKLTLGNSSDNVPAITLDSHKVAKTTHERLESDSMKQHDSIDHHRGSSLDENINKVSSKPADIEPRTASVHFGDPVNVQVDCPNCGRILVTHTVYGNKFVKCPKCGSKLFLNSAVPGEFGIPDMNGNYYVARNFYYDKNDVAEMVDSNAAQ